MLTLLFLLACPTPSSAPPGSPTPATPPAAASAVQTPTASAVDETLIDASAYLSGARVLLDDEGLLGDDNRGVLTNGLPDFEWTPSLGERLDLVIQFAQPYDLAHAVIINGKDPEQAVKELGIDVGAAPAGPWTEVGKLTLTTGQAPQVFPLVTQGTRFVRVRLLSHHGGSDYFGLDDVHLLGRRTNPENASFTGFYLGTFGEASLVQTGSQVVGCYGMGDHLEGTVEDGVLYGTWTHVGEAGEITHGLVAAALTPEGGLQGAIGDASTNGVRAMRWDAGRADSTTLDCGTVKVADEVADALKRDGKVRLFGITFDSNKDTIKPESDRTLQSLAKAMIDGKGTYTIDGHTDSQGPDDYNQGLSERRSAAVKVWLAAHGVPDASLTTAGFGESSPIEPNDTPGGRAANRRVEVTVTSG